jgi:4-hydroxy-2-oxoheptanedioate aldolase
MNLTNPVREKLDAGEKVLGCFIPLASPEIVEMVAISGFDFALIDNEHGPVSPESAYHMVLAAEAHGIPAFARVGLGERQEVLKFLDIGITGIMAPRVGTVEEAVRAISHTKYSPVGDRGLAGMRTFDYGLTKPLSDYVEALSDRVLNMIQFEDIRTLDHLEEILAVPGLDVMFVGPNDLAQSLGLPGQPNHPDVVKVVDQVIAMCKNAGIHTGTVAPTSELALGIMDRGFDMLVPSVASLFGNAAKAYIQACRA